MTDITGVCWLRNHTDNSRTKYAAYRILVAETVITIVLALLLFFAIDGPAAVSAVLGGGAYIIPNALFARYVFRYSAAVSASLAIRWFCIGEVVKLLTTMIIFAACFMYMKQVNVVVLFACYAGLMLINITSLMYMDTNGTKPDAF